MNGAQRYKKIDVISYHSSENSTVIERLPSEYRLFESAFSRYTTCKLLSASAVNGTHHVGPRAVLLGHVFDLHIVYVFDPSSC